MEDKMETKLLDLLQVVLRASVVVAIVATIAVAAMGGHADHPATEDYAGPVEKRALSDRQAILLDGGEGDDVLRFRTLQPLEGATPGGADPREE
jgi:hypothetical protein